MINFNKPMGANMKFFSAMILSSLTVLGLVGCNDYNSSTNGSNANTSARINAVAANAANAGSTNSNTATVVNSNVANTNGSAINSMSNMTAPDAFMTEAAKGGMAEVELSRLATTKSQNAEVKKFAQQMIQDHTNANAELKQLAGKKSVTLPTELDAEHKALRDKLSGLSGAEFDKEYVNAMVADHEKSVNLFKTQADNGTDADAKAFAAKTLPKLQGHLDMIKAMQGKM
jgi:putative membrane protein